MARPTDRTRQTSILGFLVTIALIPFVLDATSLLRWPSFVNSETVAVEITIGDAIDATRNEREPLFAGEPDRRSGFLAQIQSELSNTLRDADLAVDPDANAGILISIYGHSVPAADCGIDWVFYLQVSYWEGVDDDLETTTNFEWGEIGAVGDGDLESTILSVLRSNLESELAYRERNLKHFQDQVAE